jgi:predicted nucleic acid-binding protein
LKRGESNMPKTIASKTPRQFVLDSSMTMAWLFRDESSTYTYSIRRSLNSYKAVVTMVWPYEVANVMYIGWKRQRCNSSDIATWFRILSTFPIEVQPIQVNSLMSELVNMAVRHQLTVYDASYLELAWRTGLPIASLDSRINEEAVKLGIDRFDPEGLL